MYQPIRSGKTVRLLLAVMLSTAAVGGAAGVKSAPAAAAVKTSAANPEVKPVAAASAAASIVIDGKVLTLDKGTSVFMHQGRAYLPLRAAAEALGLVASWENKTKTLSLLTPTEAQYEVLDKKRAARLKDGGRSSSEGKKLKLTPLKVKFFVQGKAVTLPAGQQVFTAEGSLYVPLRFAAELTGASVQWNAKQARIDIVPRSIEGGGGDGESGLSGGETGGQPGGSEPPAPTPTPPPTGGTPTDPAPSASPPPVQVPSPGGGLPTPTPPPGGGAPTPTPPPSGKQEEQIHREGREKADALRNKCRQELVTLALVYANATTAEAKAKARQQGSEVFATCNASFDGILSEMKQQLEAGGYSTARLEEYRAEYEKELAEGKAMLDGLIGG
ncbi:copper amine oxidase N-terminal domain-containing protein [Paenibacillus pasadenensis]|uniref:copper amine oxidase N-terminal domain-containing protein n=1 Tax=Paenibacillus pasadenensis TaxID=217090 RepID=UPI002559FE91|nr:copper amine oxidase N-terminal domain-containing protein [Paenibacillus pasadenensis]